MRLVPATRASITALMTKGHRHARRRVENLSPHCRPVLARSPTCRFEDLEHTNSAPEPGPRAPERTHRLAPDGSHLLLAASALVVRPLRERRSSGGLGSRTGVGVAQHLCRSAAGALGRFLILSHEECSLNGGGIAADRKGGASSLLGVKQG